MVSPSAGVIVTVTFPFSDLSRSKLRPAIVLADSGRNDWLLCQLTSKPYSDAAAIQIEDADILDSSLHLTSYARPGKIFTANENLMVATVGKLNDVAFTKVINAIVDLLQEKLPVEQ